MYSDPKTEALAKAIKSATGVLTDAIKRPPQDLRFADLPTRAVSPSQCTLSPFSIYPPSQLPDPFMPIPPLSAGSGAPVRRIWKRRES